MAIIYVAAKGISFGLFMAWPRKNGEANIIQTAKTAACSFKIYRTIFAEKKIARKPTMAFKICRVVYSAKGENLLTIAHKKSNKPP